MKWVHIKVILGRRKKDVIIWGLVVKEAKRIQPATFKILILKHKQSIMFDENIFI